MKEDPRQEEGEKGHKGDSREPGEREGCSTESGDGRSAREGEQAAVGLTVRLGKNRRIASHRMKAPPLRLRRTVHQLIIAESRWPTTLTQVQDEEHGKDDKFDHQAVLHSSVEVLIGVEHQAAVKRIRSLRGVW